MQVTMRLDEPNKAIHTHSDPQLQYSYVQIRSFASQNTGKGMLGYESILNEFTIYGTPEQLRMLADEIYRAFPKLETILPDQPTADDEAARDFELLQESRKNTPEAMEQLEVEAEESELRKISSF